MTTQKQLAIAGPSPAGHTPSGRWLSPLPPDLLEQACRRVGVASLVFAGLWTYALVMHLVSPAGAFTVPKMSRWPWPAAPIIGAGIVMSLGLMLAVYRLHRRPYLLLDIGLAYEVATAFLVGLWAYWTPRFGEGGISWATLLILAYASIAPSTHWKTLVAALLAASMDPLACGIALLRGVEPVNANVYAIIAAFVPNYVAAGLALLPSKIIRTLGRRASQARELGSYRLEGALGSGGMGEVYRATHRLLARPAAIKLIRPDVLGARSPQAAQIMIKRFQREASAAATLRSTHTIELYDFGVADDGTFYYVMELLDGIDLETLVERFGPVPAARALHFLGQACDSLGEAHQQGLIHRDIKPSNLHTCRMGIRVDYLKVLDFGLVKLDAARAGAQTQLTLPDIVTGTPGFMAPELALGQRDADPRVDIYALGCVAYWLLTGKLLFEAETPVQMMMQHVRTPPVPPSRRTELSIPADLERVILACLAKSPDERPHDALELSRLLEGCHPPEPWTAERARRWWDAHLPIGRTPEAIAPVSREVVVAGASQA